MTCTFFGHRDAPSSIKNKMTDIIQDLIKNKMVELFYVGNQGGFDNLARQILDELGAKYYIVLAYMPQKVNEFNPKQYDNTIYPDGLECTPRKYAISKRNRWLIEKADYVVTYTTHDYGGAAQFKKLAITAGKTVIEISK